MFILISKSAVIAYCKGAWFWIDKIFEHLSSLLVVDSRNFEGILCLKSGSRLMLPFPASRCLTKIGKCDMVELKTFQFPCIGLVSIVNVVLGSSPLVWNEVIATSLRCLSGPWYLNEFYVSFSVNDSLVCILLDICNILQWEWGSFQKSGRTGIVVLFLWWGCLGIL